MSLSKMEDIDILLKDSREFLANQRTKLDSKKDIKQRLEDTLVELKEKGQDFDDMVRASTILGNVADDNTQFILGKITGVINSALAEMFREDKRKISIKQVMYRNVYPHFIVELETEDGIKRSFKQSGTGPISLLPCAFAGLASPTLDGGK